MSWKFTLSSLLILFLGLGQLNGQTCGDSFYDSGGPDGDYSNDETQDWTFCPDDPGDLVTLNFIFVDVEGCCDDLGVYNGSDFSDPLNLDVENPESFTSSAADGCLTVTWDSDFSVINGGWEAIISCNPPPPCPNPTLPVVSEVTSSGATFSWNQTDDVSVWDIEIVEAGTGATGTPTIFDVTDNPFTWSGGDSGVAYEFYLRGQCADDGEFTNWVGPVVFTTVPGCGDNFYDSGGPTGAYQNNELESWTFCPDNPGDLVVLDFTSVNVESCCDDLMIYNGSGTTMLLQGDLEAPATFTSSASDGCLTVTWDSDGSVTFAGWEATIDCIVPPPCADPSDLAVADITSTSADLSWNQIGLVSVWDIEVVPAGTPPTGTPTFSGVTDNPFELTGLDSGTEYDVYLRGQCEGEEPFTNWIGPVTFRTIPGCGDQFFDSGGPDGNYGINEFLTWTFCPDNPGDLVTLDFTFVDVEDFDFLQIYSGADGVNLLEGALTEPATFTSLDADGCLTVIFDSDFFGTTGGWAADITCAEPPECGEPLFLTSADITSSSALLGWSQVGPVAVWDIEVVPAGTPPTGTPTVSGVIDNPYLLTGLESGTEYDFYVRGQCEGDEPFSPWSGPATFRTVPGCGDQFYDPAGPNAQYANNTFETYTFCPDNPGEAVIIEFTLVEVEACCDEIAVYNGTGTGDLINGDVEQPSLFISTAADGCLTVVFDSDGSVIREGWEATISCVPCLPDELILSEDVSVEFFGATTADIAVGVPGGMIDYMLEYGPAGFTPGMGTTVTGSGGLIELEGLEESTEYEYYVTNLCDDGTESIRIGPFTFSTIWNNDIGITGLIAPDDMCGLGLGEPVRVAITNFGAMPQTLFPLNFSVNGVLSGVNQPTDGFFTGIISRDSTEEFEFDLNYSFDQPGEYIIQLWTEMENDSDLSNDTITVTLNRFAPPLYEDFEDGIPAYIGIGGNTFLAPAFDHDNETNVLAANLFFSGGESIINLPVLGPIEATDTLYFDYRYVNWLEGTDATTNLTATDVLSVLVSNDCGETFAPAFLQAGTDHEPSPDMRTVAVSLGAFAGENVQIRITGVYGAGGPDYWLDIDNINIPRCSALNAAAEIQNANPGMNDGQIIITPEGGIGPFEYEWNTGEVTDTLLNLEPGLYTVTISDLQTGCVAEVSYFVDVVNNTDDISDVIGNLQLAPNPTPGQATLRASFAEAVDAQLDVVNTLGQTVWRSELFENINRLDEQIDLSQVPNGIYFVRVQAAGQSKVIRLVKAN